MERITVAAAALNTTPLDWAGNLDRARAAIAKARELGATLVCLPELCLSGYGCEDMFLSPSVHREAASSLAQLLPETRGMVVSVGLPVTHLGPVYNTAALIADGRVLGLAAKRFLPFDGVHYEPRWFRGWPAGEVAEVEIAGAVVPMGDIVLDVGGVRIGYEICEDAWVGDRRGGALPDLGVDVVLNPSASHFAFGKDAVRRRLVLEGSRAFGVAYIYANLLGNEAGRIIYDGHLLIASNGELLAEAPRFGMDDVSVVAAVCDVGLTRLTRARASRPPTESRAAPPRVVRAAFRWPASGRASAAAGAPAVPAAWEAPKEEEFTRAVTLGLLDYLRKSGAQGYTVSLSGGSDSAACACLVALMVRLGVSQLGREGFARRLARVRGLADAADERAMIRRLLTTVYQSTRNSTEVTRRAAATLAEALEAEHLHLDIDPVVSRYTAEVAQAVGREFDWARDDLTLQNIQARARGPGVWMVANVRESVLLATSDRSEAAVGYTTMDGDTCGGLSPIAGVDKVFLRRWLRWLETTGPEGIGPIPALSAINAQRPTPELRPPEAAQLAESDLMPYDVLDAIERAAIRDKRSPRECWEIIVEMLPSHAPAQLAAWTERFFRLWCRNQWKRERYAPSFHLDDENLDPKTWCRFPILSGGFERELAELRAAAGVQG